MQNANRGLNSADLRNAANTANNLKSQAPVTPSKPGQQRGGGNKKGKKNGAANKPQNSAGGAGHTAAGAGGFAAFGIPKPGAAANKQHGSPARTRSGSGDDVIPPTPSTMASSTASPYASSRFQGTAISSVSSGT